MMWEINNKDQAVSFLLFLGLGVIFSFIYDIFKSLRLSKKHGAVSVAIEDVIYFLLLTLASFTLFIFRTGGQPRAFAYIAEAAGFLLWRLTVSKCMVKHLSRLFRLIFSLFEKIKGSISRLLGKIGDKILKVLKKLLECVKKGLKGVKRLVYNLFERVKGK